MKDNHPTSPGRSTRRHGFTLMELMVGVAASGILIAAIGSSIFIAGRAMNFDSAADRVRQAGEVVDEIAADLHVAQSFAVSDPTSVTITVPDRDGDLAPETITYSWSGAAGDPLVRTHNGQSRNMAENVHYFDLTYLRRP